MHAITRAGLILEAELTRLRRSPTRKLQAYEAYMKGRALYRLFDWESVKEARKLFERATELDPSFAEAFAFLGTTYLVGAAYFSLGSNPEEWLATLAALRAEQSKPVLDEIRTWLMTQRALPRSTLGKAIAYASGLWPGLVRFLADPKIPLDTNSVGRALRSVAVGRKNHYGSRSERGTRVAALFYSLIESAKLCAVEPRAYLGEAARRAIRDPRTITLPRDLK
jgi:transposase